MSFFNKLIAAIDRHQTLLYLELDPDPDSLPKEAILHPQGIAKVEGKFPAKTLFSPPTETDSQTLIKDWLEWLKYAIAQTAKFVCAYKLTLGYYQSLGAPGLELLQQTIKNIPADIPIILDAKHGDLNTSTIFARTIFEEWQVDAITIT